MSILVTGASGSIGRIVVRNLSEVGERVRVLTRGARQSAWPDGVEVITGDLTAQEVDPAVFSGVSRLFLFPVAGKPDAFLRGAAAAGVAQVVVLSSLAAAQEHARDRHSASAMHHLAIEAAVRDSGMDATILRPGTFANNLLAWAHSIKSFGVVEGPYPTSAQAPIHEADVADAAVAALTDDRYRGATYPLTGPEALTRVQQLDAIGTAIGRRLSFHQTTPEQFRAAMGAYMPEGIITMLLDYWSDTVTEPDVVRPVTTITGRPGRTLAQWAVDHAEAFQAGA